MSGFHSASDYIKWSFVLLLICGLFVVITYFVPFWTTLDGGAAGIWWACEGGRCYDRYNQWNESWIRAVQVFMTMTFVTWAGALFCVVCYIFAHYFYEDKRMVFLGVVASFATCLFNFIGLMTWTGGQHYGNGEVLNWAYAIGWGSCIVAGIVGFLLLLELRAPIEKPKTPVY